MHFSQPYQNLMISALSCESADATLQMKSALFQERHAESHKLLEAFPFITLYVPCYEREPNAAFLNAISAKPSPYLKAFKRSAYLSKELAEMGTPNHSSVKQYVAIEIPTKKVDLQSLQAVGKTTLQPLNLNEIKIKSEPSTLGVQIRNFFKRHFAS